MKRLLIIDDEKLYHKMVIHAVQSMDLEVETADDGETGLAAAKRNPPDVIICDVKMPRLSGNEVIQRLRRDPRFAQVPVLILTAKSELSDKLEAFEYGADDYMSKPFEPTELVARLTVLLRRSEEIKSLQSQNKARAEKKARVIAVHSLRGGVGCSSTVVNLGIVLASKRRSTLIMDLVFTSGQIALMLSGSIKRTWANISQIDPQELDWEALESIVCHHESGVHWITAPTFPSEAELIPVELFSAAFKLLRSHFNYIIADLPHDFTSLTLEVLDAADQIVVLLAPELASVRAGMAAFDTYVRLGYPPEKIRLTSNRTFAQRGIPQKKIEAVLKHPIELVLPFAPELFIEAINTGQPIVFSRPKEKISQVFRYLAARVTSENPAQTNKG